MILESLDGKRWEKEQTSKTSNTTTKTSKSNHNQTKTVTKQSPIKVRTSQNTVDIRGKRVHLAEPILEKAIDNAIEIGTLWIIHGKGTGSLREGVHQFLKSHPLISSHELAPQNEGGSGVTIAYLK